MKVKGGVTIGLIEMVVSESRDAVIGPTYTPGNRTLVFDVPAGKVTYITSVRYSAPQSTGYLSSVILPSYHEDLAAAQAFMKKHYPLLADQLQQGQYKIMPAF